MSRIDADLADEILRNMAEFRTALADVAAGLEAHEASCLEFKRNTRSDIDALKPGGRAQLVSMTDLKLAAAQEQAADGKAFRDRIWKLAGQVLLGVFLAAIGALATHLVEGKR